MTDKTIKNIILLFLMISKINVNANFQLVKIFIKKYLAYFLSPKFVENYLEYYDKKADNTKFINPNFINLKIVFITNQLKEDLDKNQRILFITNLIEFINYYEPLIFIHKDKKQVTYDAICTIADIFNISLDILENIYQFILGNYYNENILNDILVIEKNNNKTFKYIIREELISKIYILYIKKIQIYVLKKIGEENVFLNDKTLKNNYIYIFNQASIIKNEKIKPIFFSQVQYCFLKTDEITEFEFCAKNISFNYPKTNIGLKDFSIADTNNNLVGIIGSSGSGKTTLLNLLSAKLIPNTGEIFFNNVNINKLPYLTNLIGYISQDDILVEELTVYQNLYYNCKLVYGNKNKSEINKIIENILTEFELNEVKNNKIGNIFDKKISGGQRKRVNLAMEFIRQTLIMFIDEPTSGLSSSDSLKIMKLQKKQAVLGKLIYVNIHQPSSEILKLFDKIIVLDKEGYIIYTGNPVEAITYFKTIADFVDTNAYDCDFCQSLNPEQILKIVETPKINDAGDYIPQRKLLPKDLNTKYKKNIESKQLFNTNKKYKEIANVKFSNPLQQFFTYFERSFVTRISDLQYILILFFEVPILAILLSFLTKNFIYSNNQQLEYVFEKNDNFPAFIFMCITVALFYGLSISSEDIFRDRKILERERFLKLNRHSYLLSKIVFHLLNSMFQMFILTLISSLVLEIHGFMFKFWLILFSVSFTANLIGLNISDSFKNIVTIYILIPLILIPQLLLSGVIIKYDKFHKWFNSENYVPMLADVMISRWAYEAIVVEQFKNNKYNSIFFDINQQKSNKTYLAYFYIPKLVEIIEKNSAKNTFIINNEIKKFGKNFSYFNQFIDSNLFDATTLEKLKSALNNCSLLLNKQIDSLNNEIENKIKTIGADNILQMKTKYTNTKINDLVLNNLEFQKIIVSNKSIISKFEPIYQSPENKFGRSHFLAAEKLVGNYFVSTYYFNLIVIWLLILILYFAIYYRFIYKFIHIFVKIKIKK